MSRVAKSSLVYNHMQRHKNIQVQDSIKAGAEPSHDLGKQGRKTIYNQGCRLISP